MKTGLGTVRLLLALLVASSATAAPPQNQTPPPAAACQCTANGGVLTAGKLPQCSGGLVATCNCNTGQPVCSVDAAQKFRIAAEGVKQGK